MPYPEVLYIDSKVSLNPAITIERALIETISLDPFYDYDYLSKNKAIELVESIGLNRYHLSLLPSKLSSDYCQRICLARLLCLEPKLIILNNPIANLTFFERSQFLNILKTVREKNNLSYLYIAPDIATLWHLSSIIGFYKNKRIQEINTKYLICNHPKSKDLQELLKIEKLLNPVAI